MIARIWHGRATANNQHAYIPHFSQNVLPELHGINAFLGASLFKEDRGGEVLFTAITRWASLDVIRAFAGDDITKAVVEPEAQRACWTLIKDRPTWGDCGRIPTRARARCIIWK